MCISSPSQSITQTAKKATKKSKRAIVNNTESVASTNTKKIASVNNVSGMSNYDTSGRLNIS
jgi:capsular polysaccharide biosynthesis protein